MFGQICNRRSLLLSAFILLSVSLQSIILPIPDTHQEQTNWCWAASSQAILTYYGYPFTQTQIAQYGTNGANTTNYLWGAADGKNGIDLILLHFGNLYSYPYVSPVPLAESEAFINRYMPFFVNWNWTSGGAHVLVAHGVEDNTMYLMDPWYHATINSYDWVVSGAGHVWSYSLAMVEPSPQVVASAPIPEHQSSNIATATSLSWTNRPNVSSIEVKMGLTNPPQSTIYSGTPVQSLSNLELPDPLQALTSYYWQVNSTSGDNTYIGPVWNFCTSRGSAGIQIGSGTLQNTSTTYPAPYGNAYGAARHQILVKASELNAAGMNSAGLIKGVGFNISSAQSNPLLWFALKIGSTSVNSLTSWIPGLQDVYGYTTYFVENGWNMHPFSQPFYWDGISNIVLETIFNCTGPNLNSVFYQSATPGYNSTLYYGVNGLILNDPGISGGFQQRPNLLFSYAENLDDVSGLTILRNGNNVSLVWDAIYGATSYRVYCADTPNPDSWGAVHANSSVPGFSETSVDKRFYRIIAVRE